ncbi:hypothetical protein EON67_03280 [archaeon]|nr:MAG: hypothetical protein EON67_03280 [archaeon]
MDAACASVLPAQTSLATHPRSLLLLLFSCHPHSVFVCVTSFCLMGVLRCAQAWARCRRSALHCTSPHARTSTVNNAGVHAPFLTAHMPAGSLLCCGSALRSAANISRVMYACRCARLLDVGCAICA